MDSTKLLRKTEQTKSLTAGLRCAHRRPIPMECGKIDMDLWRKQVAEDRDPRAWV